QQGAIYNDQANAAMGPMQQRHNVANANLSTPLLVRGTAALDPDVVSDASGFNTSFPLHHDGFATSGLPIAITDPSIQSKAVLDVNHHVTHEGAPYVNSPYLNHGHTSVGTDAQD